MLLVMKITVPLLMLACLHVCARGFSQARLTISEKNAPLQTVLQEIRDQTGYQYFFVDQWMKEAKRVNIDVHNASMEEVLMICFRDQPFTYAIVKNTIVVKQRTDEPPSSVIPRLVDVKGRVLDDKNVPIQGVSVAIKGDNRVTLTDKDGFFQLKDIAEGTLLQISYVGYETQEIAAKGDKELVIHMKVHTGLLEEVLLTGSNGYQAITPERSAGSYDVVDNELINRSVTTNILDRIENIVPGVLFNHGDAPDQYLIRGRSTIYADAAPLIVLDNFPYDGDLGNINPNDIESITVLKDAAAAAIWGARSGNGVIVITTKRGKTAKPTVSLNSSVKLGESPDLFSLHTISSKDYIGLEQYLYAQGYYSGQQDYSPVTPVVSLLQDVSNGTLSGAQADAEIASFEKYDVRNDEKKYFYKTSTNQQHSVNVSGNSGAINYYMSAGWDHDLNLNNLVGAQYDRITLRTLNTFRVNKDIQVDAGINYTNTIQKNGNNPGYSYVSPVSGKSFYPYAQLADAGGNPLPVYTDYAKSYLDTAGGGNLLDWTYKPVADIYNENNTVSTADYVINTGVRYHIYKGLGVEVKYQYEGSVSGDNNYYNQNSYYARNMINSFTQIGPSGSFTYPVPVGGILDVNNSDITSHQGRAQLNYTGSWGADHQLTAIGGYEIRSATTTGNQYAMYGYNPENATVISNIDYVTSYSQYYNQYVQQQIQSNQVVSKMVDHFLSYYLSAAYTYRNRYILTGSGRKDEANLFGVSANQKGTPLWSLGGAWVLSNEKFYKWAWLPYVKARVTYGYNGNISRLASAQTTIDYNGGALTTLPAATIENPPNASLKWELDGISNYGIDFSTKAHILSGSIEYYRKNDKDLMGQAPVDPTWGLVNNSGQNFFYGNVANMKGQGVDLQLNSRNIDGAFKWYTDFIFSYSVSKVTRYLMPVSSSGSIYLQSSGTAINPIQGKPVYALYSYKWGGLDPSTGDPLGYVNGKQSNNWPTIENNTPLDSMVYNGPAQPTYFGAFRNTFSYKHFSASCNISYKMGYYFRTSSVSYSSLFSNWTGNSDYALRWQNPGDEKRTHVPSMIYPDNTSRDAFYGGSQVLVQRADNVRLEDVTLSYDVDRTSWKRLPFSHVKVYLYGTFPGAIWQASKYGIDPYYSNTPKAGKTISAGMNITF